MLLMKISHELICDHSQQLLRYLFHVTAVTILSTHTPQRNLIIYILNQSHIYTSQSTFINKNFMIA